MFYWGYNTNGFAHHALTDVLGILADIGYQGVGLTIDHHVLNPFDSDVQQQRREIVRRLQSLGLRSVIETGARYLLDPRKKHFPTLVNWSYGNLINICLLWQLLQISLHS